MAQNSRFSGAIDDSWLGRLTEEIIEPDLPIIDPHHHMWIRDGNTYLLPELLADVYSGHNVIATVFEECHSMYRKTGPREEASLGETEFVTGIAAIPLCQWVANRYGKKVATLGTLGLFLLWGAATWVVYNPALPYLVLVTGVIHSISNTAIWILIPSMTGDVVDHDELHTGQRREGAYAAVFSWTYKLSTTLGTAVSGLLVVWVGYDAALKIEQPAEVIHNMRLALLIVPVVFVCVAIFFMSRFPLGPTRVAENRRLLDARRTTA